MAIKKDEKAAFSLGSEVGFRIGVLFAMEQLQSILTSDDIFQALLSRVWLQFYDNAAEITMRIEHAARQHEMPFLLNQLSWLEKTPDSNEDILPLHELIKQSRGEVKHGQL